MVIRRALGKMPEKYREALVLYYREQKSTRQVGVLMGLGENATRQRISRARTMLKEQVAAMVRVILGLREAPKPADVTDALAIALTHVHRSGGAPVPSRS